MINVLSYIGMSMHSEACLWTLVGLLRTVFDATLFRVNANLKQVWQMSMPEQLSTSVQRVLRTMISGVMLLQCFTVYVYLASYIVLLYPVFLEERPTLVLPWLLLAAVRQLLCELTSLALGLGTCVLLGPARPPCIKFVIIKLISIMPAFYMWMLLFQYYHMLKLAAAFKRFPAVLPAGDKDYGLELAIRRRRTKSLLGEDQLRTKLVASLYGDNRRGNGAAVSRVGISSRMTHSTDTSSTEIIKADVEAEALRPNSVVSNRISETGSCDDWFGSEVALPRASDRILEQFVLMLLRIRAYREGQQAVSSETIDSKSLVLPPKVVKEDNLNCATIGADDADTPPLVGSSKENTASYMREYPQIFMKKTSEIPRSDTAVSTKAIQTQHESEDAGSARRARRRVSSKQKISPDAEKIASRRKQQRRLSIVSGGDISKETSNYSKEINLNNRQIKLKYDSTENNETTKGTLRSNECVSLDTDTNSVLKRGEIADERDNITFEQRSSTSGSSSKSLHEKNLKEPSEPASGEISDDAEENKEKNGRYK